MIAPALSRWVAEILADDTTGVNALLPFVPRGNDEDAPRPITVYNAFDNNVVARNAPWDSLLASEWVLAVSPAFELEHAGSPDDVGDLRDSAPVVLHLTGLTVDGKDAATLAEAHRVMRVARRVLLEAFRVVRVEGLLLEKQRVELPERWKSFCEVITAGSGKFDLTVTIPFLITDHWALGAPLEE